VAVNIGFNQQSIAGLMQVNYILKKKSKATLIIAHLKIPS